MEPEHIRLDPERTLGLELLSFPGVEIEQTIGSKHSFNTVGTLDVLHFPEYGRFVLSLHHWKFPLFKELPVIKSSEGFVDPIIFILPIDDGFYTLKFTQVFHVEGIENLETIFKNNTSYISGKDAHALMSGGYDYEPLPRASLYGDVEPDKNRTGLSNTPSVEGTGIKLRKRDIIKREVIRAADTIVSGIQKKKPENINMSVLRDYEGLVTTTEDLVPSHYLWKKDVEKMMLEGRELIQRIEGEPTLEDVYPVEHRGFLKTLRSSAHEVRLRLSSRLQHSLEMARSTHDESQPRTSFGEKLVTRFPAIGRCVNPSHDVADHEYEAHLPSYLVNREDLNQAIYTSELHHHEQQQQSLLNRIKERIPPMPSCGRGDHMDRGSTLTIVERVKKAIPHHDRPTEDQTFDYRPEGSGIKEKLMVDIEALKYHATEYAHLAREKVPEKIHNLREGFKNPEGQNHPTLGEKVVDNLRGFKHQVEEYAHLVAENEKVIHMVDKVKAKLHDVREQLDARKNYDMSTYDIPIDQMMRADSMSAMEDYQMQPVDVQPMHVPSQIPSLSERITDIFVGQLQAGNIQENVLRGGAYQQDDEPLDFVCTIPSHNHHLAEECQGEPIEEVLQGEMIEEQLREIVKEQLPEGVVLVDQPVTMLDDRWTQSEPAPEFDDSTRKDLITEEMENMQNFQSDQRIISQENNMLNEGRPAETMYREKEVMMYEPEFLQPTEQLEAVESSRRRVHIFDDKTIVGTGQVVRSHRTPKKIFDGVRNSQEFESMTHSQG